jgi:hypothetical protein
MNKRAITNIIVILGIAVGSLIVAAQNGRLKWQPVELNHIFVTLQKDTIDAITKSKFLGETFAMLGQKTIKSAKASWTGTYVTGWRAYLELFAPGGAENLSEGSSGICFSTSKLGDGTAVKIKLESIEEEETFSFLRRRVEDQESIPWCDIIGFESLLQAPMAIWLVDFRTEYIDYKKIQLSPDGQFERHGYNASFYTEPEQKKAFASRLFDDLLEVYLELNASESASFDRFITSLGYRVAGDSERQSYHSGNFAFFVSMRPSPHYRIRKVVCSLKKAVEPKAEYTFGPDASLTVQGNKAVWKFGKD